MHEPLKHIAFIPVRGGSKSIPGKNIKLLAGKPLVLWTVEAASASEKIDEVIVSTDSPQIRSVIESANVPKVRVIDRSAETATDTASTESAMIEYAMNHEFEHIILIQATSPLLQTKDLDEGLQVYHEANADSLLSVVEQKRFIWNCDVPGSAKSQNYNPSNRPRRQDFSGYAVENGSFYVCSRKGLLENGSRLHGKIAAHKMNEASYYEIDEPSDWLIVEALLLSRSGTNSPGANLTDRAKKIKLFLTDVDGVLTDAGMYYSENGDELKKFSTRDGKAFELLRKIGIKTGIITSENTKIVERRAKKLSVDFLFQGAEEKITAYESIQRQTGLRDEEIAYMGDDLADIPLLTRVGLAACPADAMTAVQALPIFNCETRGGDGCVRELAELILSAQRI